MRNGNTIESHYDAIVVGARIAGAATAMLLARAGLRVLAVDKSRHGSDTLSTHALMRPGVFQLQRWGVLDSIIAAGTPVITKTTFHYGDEAIEVAIKEKDGIAGLYAPRRTVLDAALADAAQQSGAQILYRARVEGVICDQEGRVCGVELADSEGARHRVGSEIVIGADGVRSIVARTVGAEVVHKANRFAAVLYGYWRGLALGGTHWYYGKDIAAGAIPTNEDMTCLFVAMPPDRYERGRVDGLDALFHEVLGEADRELAAAAASRERDGKLWPFPGREGFMRKGTGAGWALVGDAGCFRDPITAHGMTDALRDAESLASAVISGTEAAMKGYESARDEIAVEFLELSDRIASFEWDFESLKDMHLRLSELMSCEYALVRALDRKGATAAA
jgi:menaquinone-9 beta-reductase